MKAHFEMFAAYNGWANRRLYEAAAAMDEATRNADAGGFFGSLQGALNHMLVADRIWMRRFTGDGPAPDSLTEIPYPEFRNLCPAREAEDERIIDYAAGLTEDALAADFTYRTITGRQEVTQPLAPALAHFFNHQTHHRGQCHHMLTAAGREAPPLDLIFYQREAR